MNELSKMLDEPQGQTRTQRRVAQMRRSLVDAAEALLIEGGVAAVTAEDVARRADVSLQTVYNRIGGRAALLLAIAEQAVEQNRAYMDAAYNSDGTPEERLWRACDAYMRFALERPHQFRIVANPPDAPEAAQPFIDVAGKHLWKLAAVIRDGVEDGTLSSALDPQSAAIALWAMMNGLLSMALRIQPAGVHSVGKEEMIRSALGMLELGVKSR